MVKSNPCSILDDLWFFDGFRATAREYAGMPLLLQLLEFGERLDLVLWETCHIYAICQAYRAEADFQHSPISKRAEYASLNGLNSLKP